MGTVASAIYNTNIVDKDKMTTAGDFVYPTMEEIIERDVERKNEQQAWNGLSEREQKDSDVRAWEQHIARMTAGRKPLQTTIKG